MVQGCLVVVDDGTDQSEITKSAVSGEPHVARRDSRWHGIVVVVGLAGLAAGLLAVVVTLGRNGLQTAADVAQLVAVLLTIVSLAAGLLLWRWRSARVRPAPTTADIGQAKDVLAGLVFEQWKFEAARRSLDDPDPMPVRWRLTDEAMDHPRHIADGAVLVDGSSDQIAKLTHQFRALRRRRLVILGGPGTGKTTLAVQLVLELLASPEDDEPVPVLMSVAGWDTEAFPRLQDWLAVRLRQDYPALRATRLGEEAPPRLAARGQLLPVLDGLDELPEAARAKVITALNGCLGDADQLILTSRTTAFTQAVQGAGDALTSAAVIEPEPLTRADAADYLEACLPPDPGPAWEQILTDLRGPAQSSGPPLPVTEIVSTPLGLWLLRTVYLAPGADPAPLRNPGGFRDAAALRAHLFDRLVRALITTRSPGANPAEPFRPHRDWDVDQAHRWLGYLARYLRQIPTHDGQRGTPDFAWWDLARFTLRPRTLPLLVGLVGGLMVGLANGLLVGVGNRLVVENGLDVVGIGNGFDAVRLGLQSGLGAGLTCGLGGALLARSWSKQTRGFADFHVSGRLSLLVRLMALYGLGTGLLVGLWNALGVGLLLGGKLILGLLGGLGLGAVVGLGLGVIVWAETPTPEGRASTPMSSWRADRTLNLSKGIAGGLGLTVGLVGAVVVTIAGAPTTELMIILVAALVVGLGLGTGVGKHHAWVAYLVATYRLAWGRRLPRRLMLFLDDAHRLGLLRAVGPLYQFRHAEFQDHLAKTEEASGGSPVRVGAAEHEAREVSGDAAG
jgi:hypothetical protein